MAHWRNVLARDPRDARAHHNQWVALAQKGQPDAAAESLRQAIANHPRYAEAHFNLGNVLLQQRKPDEALAAFRQAIEIKPDYFDAYLNLGSTLTEKGRSRRAGRGTRPYSGCQLLRCAPQSPLARRRRDPKSAGFHGPPFGSSKCGRTVTSHLFLALLRGYRRGRRSGRGSALAAGLWRTAQVSGETIWKCAVPDGDAAAYASAIVVDFGGVGKDHERAAGSDFAGHCLGLC
jgi:tetratricopeptide (TPR) repeat protein